MDGFDINGKVLIGIDHGYGNMKTRHYVFKSGVKCYDKEPLASEEVVHYNGMFYVIGESHKAFIASKDEDEDYFILTLTAIAKELRYRGMTDADVIVAAGLPIHWLSNQKDAFREYLMRSGNVEYEYNDVIYRIRIADVAIYPQGYAGIASSLPLYRGVNMLADIGNGTMNTLVITNGRPISDKVFTDKLGVQQCVKRIYYEVQAACGKVPDESIIEDFLKNGRADVSEKIQEVMRKEAVKYAKDIFQKLSEYEYDPELVKLHIIGGGGCIIKNFGEYTPDRVEIISDICATAKGYESLYLTQYTKRKGA